MNDKQKAAVEKLLDMPKGTILRKGKVERILYGIGPGMVYYKTKSSKTKVTGLNIRDFIKWLEDAEVVGDV